MKKFIQNLNLLSPLERFDFNVLQGRSIETWTDFSFYVLVLLGLPRMTQLISEGTWHLISHWSFTLAGWIAFLCIPSVVYQLISKRKVDNTLEFEVMMPITRFRLLTGKYKVALLAVLRWLAPLLLLGYIADPFLQYNSRYLFNAYQITLYTEFNPFVVVALTLLLIVALWSLFFFLSATAGLTGKSILELYGIHIFLLFTYWLLVTYFDLNITFGVNDFMFITMGLTFIVYITFFTALTTVLIYSLSRRLTSK